jgi:hypothetical protein
MCKNVARTPVGEGGRRAKKGEDEDAQNSCSEV